MAWGLSASREKHRTFAGNELSVPGSSACTLSGSHPMSGRIRRSNRLSTAASSRGKAEDGPATAKRTMTTDLITNRWMRVYGQRGKVAGPTQNPQARSKERSTRIWRVSCRSPGSQIGDGKGNWRRPSRTAKITLSTAFAAAPAFLPENRHPPKNVPPAER